MTNEPIVIPKWAWVGLTVLALLLLGLFVSPHDQENRPILLLPDAKAVEDYRSSIWDWHERMKSLDSEITTVLSGRFGSDLFSKSREAQKIMDTAIHLAQEIERQDVPTAAIPAKSLLLESASSYLNASRAMLQWVTAPNEENLTNAQRALNQARQSIEQLEQSEWINP